jgi:hypothetical protein
LLDAVVCLSPTLSARSPAGAGGDQLEVIGGELRRQLLEEPAHLLRPALADRGGEQVTGSRVDQIARRGAGSPS